MPDWLTHWLTTLKDRPTQLFIKYKSGALVTQFHPRKNDNCEVLSSNIRLPCRSRPACQTSFPPFSLQNFLKTAASLCESRSLPHFENAKLDESLEAEVGLGLTTSRLPEAKLQTLLENEGARQKTILQILIIKGARNCVLWSKGMPRVGGIPPFFTDRIRKIVYCIYI